MINDNNINWLGNRVIDNNSPFRPSTTQEKSFFDEPYISTYDTTASETQIENTNTNDDNESAGSIEQESRRNDERDSMWERNQNPMRDEQGPPPVMNEEYLPGYLQTIIGKNVRAEFLLGGTLYVDKTGILREVGVNYFILEDYISRARILCDLYSVKFVTTL